MRMISQRDVRRAVRHGERELRAASGDFLSQLNPRNIARDARDLALRFARNDALHDYLGPRMWGVVAVVLVFVLVSSVCSIDVMIKSARYMPGIFSFLVGLACWAVGVTGLVYVFAIWVEGRAAQKDRLEHGGSVQMPAGFLAYLKYSRALVPWIAVALCVALPLLVMAPRAPLVALGLLVAAVAAPVVFRKFDS